MSRLRPSTCIAFALTALLAAQGPDADQRHKFLSNLSSAAIERTQHIVRYDPAYVRLTYPGGDVPADTGVCTDEVIRAYRAVGIDLQKEVHEDMAANFSVYPRKWGRREPDANIDHRRVPNLMVFFSRKGESLPITDRALDYASGDLVAWEMESEDAGDSMQNPQSFFPDLSFAFFCVPCGERGCVRNRFG